MRAPTLTRQTLTGGIAAFALVACSHKQNTQTAIQTATVTRRNIIVTAQATGTVEPVDTVPVKSQASGLIIKMPVDVGSIVKPGDLLAQIDTRLLTNDYQRAVANEKAAVATLRVDNAALGRADTLYAQKVMTATEHEAAVVAQANAAAALIGAQTSLRTAQQNLAYATVRAEVGGTVISKAASVGTVVSSAVATFGGGSTILTLADLHRVRMRALVNETDIGNVHAGMPVTVTVDAFPNRQFAGTVEKVEPQAIIQQSVTMFPVLVSLPNLDLALLPGMNGEVTIVTQQAHDVVAVPNDAVRSMRDASLAASVLGVNPDSVAAALQRPGGGGGRGGRGGRAARGGGGGGGGGGFTAPMIGTGPGGSAGGPEMVFVRNGKSWSPRTVRLGVSDFDYSQVLSGLHDGDVVALLGAAVLQAQRDQVNARVRRFTGGGLPGTGSSTTSTKKPAAKPAGRPTGPPAAKPAGPAPHGGGGR